MFSLFLRQDYSFPTLEVFAFLFVISILIGTYIIQGYNETYIAYSYFGASATISLPILIFMILIWKNISFGLGGDFEKGVMQTFLTYPLSRTKMLGARLLSAIGVALGILSLAQFIVLSIIAPGFTSREAPTLILNYLSVLATPLLVTMIVLLVCVLAKSSGIPLIVGILLYFLFGLFLELFVGYAVQAQNHVLLGVAYLLNPALAFQNFYSYNFNGGFTGIPNNALWAVPSFPLSLSYLAGNFAISIVLLFVSFVWFRKRLEV